MNAWVSAASVIGYEPLTLTKALVISFNLFWYFSENHTTFTCFRAGQCGGNRRKKGNFKHGYVCLKSKKN
jgi:hypothetical protein